MRFLRLRCRLEEEDWNQHIADRKKLVLMICLLLSFILGGYVGSAGYKAFKLHALLIPAGLTTILGVMHIAYCILKREEVAEEKIAETVFRRQISGNAHDDVDDPESAEQQQQLVQSKSPAMRFIRQISGQKPDPSSLGDRLMAASLRARRDPADQGGKSATWIQVTRMGPTSPGA